MPLKNAPARTRELLGALLESRRLELSPDYYERTAFAELTGVNLRLVQDLERGGPPAKPRNVTPVTMRDVIAPAYKLAYESIEDTITSGEDRLEAAPGSPPRRARPAAQPPPAAPEIGAGASDEELEPYVRQIRREIADAVARYGPEATGEQIFSAEHEAAAWDSRQWPPGETVRILALFRSFAARDVGGQPGVKTGLSLTLVPAGCT